MTPNNTHWRAAANPRCGRYWPAAVLILLGAAAIVYGAALHVIPVLVEPAKPAEEPATPESLAAFAGLPGMAPPPAVELVVAPDLVPAEETEPNLVQAVSVGNATRLPSGGIKRSFGGTQCPT